MAQAEGFTPDRHQKILSKRPELQKYVQENAKQGDIQSVIDTIDKFAWSGNWLMNIGDKKGLILDQAIQTRKPKTVLELGTFLGYSGLRIIAQLPEDALFISIEPDAVSFNVARSNFEYAGVGDRVKTVNDYSQNVIPNLSKDFNIDSFDLIFIDHYKEVYLRDCKMLEEAGLIKSGTMIVADNVITPGTPDYLEYIRNNSNYTSELHESTLEYRDNVPDGVEISVRK